MVENSIEDIRRKAIAEIKEDTKISPKNENNGVASIKIYRVEYTFWTHAKIVIDCIKDYLKKKFPGKLVIRELNQIDLSIPEENLPVEIQSTHIVKGGLHYSGWEERIRKQIDQDIIYGKCLFFFDDALLRAMKNAGRGISINMDWLRKYMKEGKLEVYTVTYDGIVKSKEYKDFDFLAKISQTCPMAVQNDDMILNKNKMKIYIHVIKGYGFTQEEIDKFDSDFEKYRKISKISGKDNYDRIKLFLKRQTDERAKLYGTILQAMGGLSKINQILCRSIDKDFSEYIGSKYLAKILGILDVRGHAGNAITKFIDRFDICKYFPGYLRNKETWDKLRGYNLNGRQFDNVITGKTDVIKGIDHYFNENSSTNSNKEENIIKEVNQNQSCDDKEVNIKIDNKDQIINISIKTKQKSIEDAWT